MWGTQVRNLSKPTVAETPGSGYNSGAVKREEEEEKEEEAAAARAKGVGLN